MGSSLFESFWLVEGVVLSFGLLPLPVAPTVVVVPSLPIFAKGAGSETVKGFFSFGVLAEVVDCAVDASDGPLAAGNDPCRGGVMIAMVDLGGG